MRSILLNVDSGPTLELRLQLALSLARATGGHLSCLHVTPIGAYTAFDGFGGVFVMDQVIDALTQQEASLRSNIEERLAREDVSWDYAAVTGSVVHTLLGHASLADVLITGRHTYPGYRPPSPAEIGDLLLLARSPMIVVADEPAPFDPTGKAVIAWNGRAEAAHAVRGAIGLLKLASSVDVIRVGADDRSLFPSTRVLEYLSRHDIHANLVIEDVEPDFVAAALVAKAQEAKAAYLVMGGYGHTRIGEYIFGGVTRSLLTACPVHLVLSH
jgi:nucleotide-binding universal stress UspA family protein